MKLFSNAWFWFALFCVGLFFLVIHLMGLLTSWAGASVKPEPDYSQGTIKVIDYSGEQLSSPTHFVQGSANTIQPDVMAEMSFMGVR